MEKLELARLRAVLKSVTATEFFFKNIGTYLNPLLDIMGGYAPDWRPVNGNGGYSLKRPTKANNL